MARLKNQVKASNLFIKYIITFCIETIVILFTCLMIFILLAFKGFFYPANYYEKYIQSHISEIKTAEKVKDFIPENCEYAIYQKDGTFLEGNISESKISEVWTGIQNTNYKIIDKYYEIVERESQICIIFYELHISYSNSFLERHLPNPGFMTILIFILLFIINTMRISKQFGKILSSEMSNLNKITGKIQEESLEFELKPSKIIEIDKALQSLLKLREGLKDSLDKQWKLESARRDQIAALGHDLKTPITIVKGNIELLNETKLDEEQSVYVKSSLENLTDMQYYIQKLLEINATNEAITLQREEVDIEDFLNEIISNIAHIARQKNITIILEQDNPIQKLIADKVLVKRAIVNILENAIEYSKENSRVLIKVNADQEKTKIVIEDAGEGFTKEALQMATEQFFRSDKSRNSKFHYGMGLYIAKNIVKLHEGDIVLGCSEELGGARVELSFNSIGNTVLR